MPSRRPASSIGPALLVLILACSMADRARGQAQEADQRGVGTWKLNVARSKLGPGPAPRSMVCTIEAVGDQTRMTGIRVAADGLRTEARFTAPVDGKDYPIRGSANADTVSLRRVDARTVERVDKRLGKVVETSTTVYSPDGKTSTTTGKGKSALGHDFEYVAVNEKQ